MKVARARAALAAALGIGIVVGCGATNADVAAKQRNLDRCRLQAELARDDGADPEEPGQRVCAARERELGETKRSRDKRQAVANGLSGVGEVLGAAAGSAPSGAKPSTTSALHKECSNDFTCGIGFRCVKPNYLSVGTCMRLVDGYGAPQFDTPRANSVGPKMPEPTDCGIDTDCPIGFRCDHRSGACIRG